jgi:hypothetical protein
MKLGDVTMIDLQYGLFNSSYRHIRCERLDESIFENKKFEFNVAREEKFACQMMMFCKEEFYCFLDSANLSWKGMQNRVRIEIDCEKLSRKDLRIYFEGYVNDDSGKLVADPILKKRGQLIEAEIGQMFWIEGKIPNDFADNNLNFDIKMYFQQGYDDEVLMASAKIDINVSDVVLKPLNQSDFFLDLWQHPSNWARMYELELWSDEHFRIIENNLRELASMGQKVAMVIVSEMPWAGQSCYKFSKNASNLFEYNIVDVFKDEDGNIDCDFKNFDRYIDMCFKLGIDREIDLYGLLGVWGGRDFGNPLADYKYALRLRYFDRNDGVYKYINSKYELKQYVSKLFNHIIENGWWNITRLASDEPASPDIFDSCVEFLNSSIENDNIKMKAAVCHKEFIDEYKDKDCDLSLYLGLILDNKYEIKNLRNKLNKDGKKLTWYLMCVPNFPNNFIDSPPIESRVVGWYTYYFGVNGFLRWDYAIWPKEPLNNPSYKFPHWKAGDMFFVYPGKDGKPMSSLRWENLRFGIQDHQLLLLGEEKLGGKEYVDENLLSKLLGNIDDMRMNSFLDMDMNYSLNYSDYEKIRSKIFDLK